MKKIWKYGVLLALPLVLAGCGNKPSEGSNKNKEITSIKWTVDGALEAQKGQSKNIGTAGLLYGKTKDYIVVGGGANFPEEPVAKGGAKKLYPDIYVLKNENGDLKQVDHTTLDYEIGYGSSITTEEGIYYVGGSPNKEEGNNVSLITTDEKGKIGLKHIGDLPFTFSDGFAVKKDKDIYLGFGKQDGKASNKVYKFNVETGKTEELKEIPGEPTRNQAVAQLLGDDIYVFSGGDKIAYTDGYKYSIKDNSWTQVADVKIGNEEISLLGANSVKLNEDEMLVIGGFNKAVYDDAVKNLNTLKDESLAEFKKEYFGRDPQDFAWNTKVLIYNSKNNQWKSIGDVPFNAPCGEALILDGDNIFSINGEIKPGIRTNKIYSGELIYKK